MIDATVSYEFPGEAYGTISQVDELGRTIIIELTRVTIVAGGDRTGGATDIIIRGAVPSRNPEKRQVIRELVFHDGGPTSRHRFSENATVREYIDIVNEWELRRTGSYRQDDPRDNEEW